MKETMNNTPKKTPKSGKEIRLKNLRPPWKPGQSGNLVGRSKGSRNFKTVFEEASKEVAEALKLGKEPNKVSVELVKRGIKEGLSGNFPFYKDILDRVYGQAKQPIEEEFLIEVNFKKKDEDKEAKIRQSNQNPLDIS